MILKDIIDLIHDQNKFAESKNSAVIVFTSALLVGIISGYSTIQTLLVYDKPIFGVILNADFMKTLREAPAQA